ncbi:MAG: aminotransferase class V-fold PLP-dependent enzyme, partial [Caldilineaceae bacterium]
MTPQRRSIYLDHAATTPVRAEVQTAMAPYFAEFYGNPSSIHGVGRKAGVALQEARRTIAA